MNITSHKIKAKIAAKRAELWFRRIQDQGAVAKARYNKWNSIAKWHREQIRLLRHKHAKD